VELAKDWRSGCLEKQNLLNIGICGVLGRLHSSQGLAHSNNNAKLNDSTKHETNAAGTSEIERTTSKEERVQQKAVFLFFASIFLQKFSKLII
jgi:hypothetical protein